MITNAFGLYSGTGASPPATITSGGTITLGNGISMGAGSWNPPPYKQVEIEDIHPKIIHHKRLYSADLDKLSKIQPELIQILLKNRLVIQFTPLTRADENTSLHRFVPYYEKWLDENIEGFYTIEDKISSFENHEISTGLIISFEVQSEMIQFTMRFR